MKKITVLILALCLAVPVQAWHLFPVREKEVIVEKTKISWVACIVSSAIALILGILIRTAWVSIRRKQNIIKLF